MSTTVPNTSSTDTAAVVRRVAFASFLGNFLEWFDYGTYLYFTAAISQTFFPSDDKMRADRQTYAVLAISFALRPIGALVWGYFGDKWGRKWSLSVSILMMTGATCCIGLVPSHAAIGIAAPLILLLLRMIQGFSASGEYAGAATFLAEYAPVARRGTYVSLVPASTATGLLAGSAFASILGYTMSAAHLASWGWRIPFILALPLGFVALAMWRTLHDSPAYLKMQGDIANKTQGATHPIRDLLTRYRKRALIGFLTACLNAVGFYIVLTYLPTYLDQVTDLPSTTSHVITSVTLICYIAMIFATGTLSDRMGRKKMLTAACVGFIVLAIPAFAILSSGRVATTVVVELVLCACLTINDGSLASFLTESFPTHVRYTGFAFTFNMANAIFGGTAPFICTWLIRTTGSAMAPAYYLAGVACLALIAILSSPDHSAADLAVD